MGGQVELDQFIDNFNMTVQWQLNNDNESGFRKITTRNQLTNRSNQLLQCVYCYKTYRKLFNIKAHIRKHRGLRPFHCTSCNQSFVQKSNLKRHLQNGCNQV